MRKLKYMLAIMALIGGVAFADNSGFCLSCHSETMDLDEYGDSVHGAMPCVSCHVTISAYPHETGTSVNCIYCHLENTARYRRTLRHMV